jgi:hypothetical protein
VTPAPKKRGRPIKGAVSYRVSYAESLKHCPTNEAFVDALREFLGLGPLPRVSQAAVPRAALVHARKNPGGPASPAGV